MQKVIVLGAASAIARQVERLLAQRGKEMLLVGRNFERLEALRADLLARGAGNVLTCEADLSDCSRHRDILDYSVANFAGFDTVLLAYGTMLNQSHAEPELVLRQLQNDFVSAAVLLTIFAKYFEERREGCIAAITSVAGDRGRRSNYVYGAAKGGLSIFLQGLRSRLTPAGVSVITIKPGPVRTPMTAHMRSSSLLADAKTVAGSIYRALERRSPDVLYTPGFWRWIMTAIRAVPEPVAKRLAW